MLLCPMLILNALNVDIDQPQIANGIFLNELPVELSIGNPQIPYVPVKILLPMGESLTHIQITLQSENSLQAGNLDYVRTPQPMSVVQPDQTRKNEQTYNTNAFYPNEDYRVLGTQRYKGYDLLLVNLFPYKYNPVSGEVVWYSQAEISFDTAYDHRLREEQNRNLIVNSEVTAELHREVYNRQAIHSYHKTQTASSRTLVDPNDPYSMLIITDETREPYFDDFISWKISHGVSTSLFLTSDIYNEYTGADNPEKIKNFIIDAYQTYSATDTPLEYIILGGDDEIIPIRGVFVDANGTIDEHMPCDAYFSCLDNNWDGNGNGVFGEIADNVDMIPEIAIGRIPAESESEFNQFFHKTYYYVDQTSFSNDVFYGFGESLNNNPQTWGGDYMDAVLDEVPSIEEDYHVYKLYEREGTFSSQTVKDAIDNGVGIINHMGHANQSYVMGQYTSQCATYTNTEYGFAYTQGCYPAAFDEATSMATESVAENMVFAEGGLFAFVGNTRYGWYSPGSTNGPSQPYDIEFFKAIFTNDIRQLGKALNESRIVLANQAVSNVYLRWVHYELVLFGDPSIEVKYANGSFPYIEPTDVAYDDSVTGDGDNTPNPGETIEIYVELENQEGWANAIDVTASIEFNDPAIQVLTGSINYESIPCGTTATSDPFVVQIPQECNYDFYNYSITVNAPVGNGAFTKSFEQSFEVSLFQQNWPWTTINSIISNPMIYDFDGDGTPNLLLIDAEANINLLNADTSIVSGYPWLNEENIWKSTALADITGDDQPEIIIASRTGRIFAYDNTGNEVFSYQADEDQLLTPVAADIDGDGEREIVSFGLDKILNLLNPDGTMASNFPVVLPMLSFCEIAAADLNEDNAAEIIIGTMDNQLHAINYNGSENAGFPVVLDASICSAPIVLNNLKIAVGTNNHKLVILDNNGVILLQKDTASKIAASPIAADFDNDGILEIAYLTINGIANIIEQDGTELSGWPIQNNCTFTNPPITADIDNDNDLELLYFSSNNKLFVYHHDGTEVAFAPVPVNLIGNTPASIEDVDLDGDFDVIAGISTGAFIIDIKLTKGVKTPWKTYRGNYCRTGYYNDNELTTEVGEVLPPIAKASLNQNFPNPFNPSTTISFALNENAVVDLEIYNIKGQKVRSLVSSKHLEKGVINLQWNGHDDAGKSVGTGVYFYQLQIDHETIDTKKCLLLK